MPSHKQRMHELSHFTLPNVGTPEWEHLKTIIQVPGKEHIVEAQVRKLSYQSFALRRAQFDNGTEMPASRQVRLFALEYNSRILKAGLSTMPSSFNVMEAFFDFHKSLYLFALHAQLDHSLPFSHFIDRITDGSIDCQLNSAVETLREGVIYNIENQERADSFLLRDGERQFGFGGASVVRHGSEVAVMLVCGEKTDLAARTLDPNGSGAFGGQPFESMQLRRGKERIKPAPDLERRAEPLEGYSDMHKLVVLTRFDVGERTRHVTDIMEDWGNSFTILTNNPEVLGPEDSVSEFIEAMSSKMSEYGVLLELCKTLLWFPVYADQFSALASERRYRTRYCENVGSLSYANVKKFAPVEERLAFRNVTTFEPTAPRHQNGRRGLIVAPEFKLESTGFWKTLSPLEQGEDKHGNPVMGKTWVTQVSSWVAKSPPEGVVVTDDASSVPPGPDPGWIYVMRDSSHPRNVFKVGLTRRDSRTRARELSGTGSFEGFLVVNEWPTGNCVEAERRVHERLADCRINAMREFFALPFEQLAEAVREILAELAQGS